MYSMILIEMAQLESRSDMNNNLHRDLGYVTHFSIVQKSYLGVRHGQEVSH